MNKNQLNRYFSKFGFEVHGTGYIQKIRKASFKEDAFQPQKDILGGRVASIFDVGANRGDTVIEYNNLFPGATIHAFEPFPGSYEVLESRVKELKNVTVHREAVAATPGRRTLYVNNNVDTNSLLPSNVTGLQSDKLVANKAEIEVEVCTIDQFCEKNNIDVIDILKLDIQGGELDALKGCTDLLSKKKIRLIYSETYFIEQYVGHPLFHELSAFLFKYNYRLQDLYNPFYGKGSIAWCDSIFLPAE